MSELSMTEYEQDCKPLAPMPKSDFQGVLMLPFGYGVIDHTGQDVELFATREGAIARARECHRNYIHIRPFRVVKITMEPLDDDPDEREVRERETLTERRTCEAEERYRAMTEGGE